jgi:hypothetical protein
MVENIRNKAKREFINHKIKTNKMKATLRNTNFTKMKKILKGGNMSSIWKKGRDLTKKITKIMVINLSLGLQKIINAKMLVFKNIVKRNSLKRKEINN